MGVERLARRKAAQVRQAVQATEVERRPAVARQYTVGRADDAAEARADAAADAAMRSLLSTDWQPSATSTRIRRAAAPSSAASTIGLEGGALDDATAATLHGAIGRGRPMSDDVGERVRRSLGHDVSDVRVHTDRTADTIASRIQASAFTVGRDIFFASGQYRPDSADGMHTILHEASHVAENGTRIARATVRRKINTTAKHLQSAVGVGGRIKAAFTSSQNAQLYDDVVKFLREYEKADVAHQAGALNFLMLACERFLNLSADAEDPTRLKQRSMVEDLHAEAFTEHGKLRAQQAYTKAAYSDPDATNPETSGLWNQSDAKGTYKVRKGAKALAAGKTTPNAPDKAGGFDDAALKEMRRYKLTEAEVLAIRTYTAGDYGYINSAMVSYQQESPAAAGAVKTEAQTRDESNAAWWGGRLGAKSGDAKAQLRAEGGMHAGVALSGLNKLPVTKVKTYRGMQYPAALVPIDLVVGKTITWSSFTSTSVDLAKASGFLKPTDPTATVFEIKVTNGRDLRRLSVFHSMEGEVLLLPGAKVVVRAIGTVPGQPHLRMVQVEQIA